MQHQPDPPDFDEPDPEPATALGETVNVAEPAEVKRQLKKQAQKAKTSAEFWQEVLSTTEGRKELWGILAEANTFGNKGGMTANGGYDPALTGFIQGKRDLGHRIFLTWMSYDQAAVMLMIAENEPRAAQVGPTGPKKSRGKTPT